MAWIKRDITTGEITGCYSRPQPGYADVESLSYDNPEVVKFLKRHEALDAKRTTAIERLKSWVAAGSEPSRNELIDILTVLGI